MAFVDFKNVWLAYNDELLAKGHFAVEDISLQVEEGEFIAIVGPSGCGKSTFMKLTTGLKMPSRGSITIGGQPVTGPLKISGMAFQAPSLLPWRTTVDNVLLPLGFSRRRAARVGGDAATHARALLQRLELDPQTLAGRPAAELSVGQQQRVAAARALIGGPELVIADEPTSALDSDARDAFLGLLFEECRRAEAALLFVSHDRSLQERFDRVLDLPAINQAGAGGCC